MVSEPKKWVGVQTWLGKKCCMCLVSKNGQVLAHKSEWNEWYVIGVLSKIHMFAFKEHRQIPILKASNQLKAKEAKKWNIIRTPKQPFERQEERQKLDGLEFERQDWVFEHRRTSYWRRTPNTIVRTPRLFFGKF